jgi:2-polyprenyl-6-methoxyphenol hydroxylase-like FAD-dependent oxidoreductase
MDSFTEVVVVGAGPTGLMLASELSLMGVTVTELERLPEPTGLSKALGLWPRSQDTLDLRGLLERFDGRPVPAVNFAAFTVEMPRLESSHPHGLAIPQARIEELLEGRARELGAEIRRGHELSGLHQEEATVVIDVQGPDRAYQMRAGYLVGCDGAHSVVRHAAGIGFPGTGPTVSAVLGDVRLPQSMEGAFSSGSSGFGLRAGITRTETGIFAAVPLEPGIVRLTAIEWGRPAVDHNVPVTLGELQDAIRRVLGEELPMSDPRWLSRYNDSARQAERYRNGRVLLAGDAAHVHFPFGGQGLNMGLQDAANLGWKLAATVHGWAPPGLLDTYHAERHPVGERVLMNTRAQVTLSVPGEQVTALRELFSQLLAQEQVRRYIVEMITAVDIRYDMGNGDSERQPLVGRWAPDLPLVTADGRIRVAQLMHSGKGMLLDLAGRTAVRNVAVHWADRVDVVTARCADGHPPAADMLLIRPDGYVAWVTASEEPDGEAQSGLRRALVTWFGVARPGGGGSKEQNNASKGDEKRR